jgi:hypothetical protein
MGGRTAVTFSSLRVRVPVLCTHTLGAVVADDVRLMEGEILARPIHAHRRINTHRDTWNRQFLLEVYDLT